MKAEGELSLFLLGQEEKELREGLVTVQGTEAKIIR